jgi:hypothetical protein
VTPRQNLGRFPQLLTIALEQSPQEVVLCRKSRGSGSSDWGRYEESVNALSQVSQFVIEEGQEPFSGLQITLFDLR